MIERIGKSTFSSSNVHGVVDDNHNSYRNMVVARRKIRAASVGDFSLSVLL
jgi:hypothetical protein